MRDRKLISTFMNIMTDSSIDDWLWFLKSGDTDLCPWYSAKDKAIFATDLPWPVRYILTRYHHKHRHNTPASQNLQEVKDATRDLCHKIRWRWHFRNTEKEPQHTARIKGMQIKPYEGNTNPALETWLRALSDTIFQKCKIAKSRHHSSSSTLTRLDKHCLASLNQDSTFVPVKQDKMPGYVLMNSDEFEVMLKKSLEKTKYVPYGPLNIDWNGIRDEYLGLAKQVTKKHPDWPMRYFRIGLGTDWRKLASRLKATIKTHKDRGDMKPRIIHASAGYPFAVLSRWLMKKLDAHVYDSDLVIKNTDALIERIKSTPLIGNEVLLKLDIKDFFLSGSSEMLVEDALAGIEDPDLELLRKILHFLTERQYVQLPRMKSASGKHTSPSQDLWWRCIVGTGMGLPHSGSLANSAFAGKVERTWITKNSTKAAYGIFLYARYMDDIFIVLRRDFKLVREFISELSRRSGYFIMQVESCSLTHATMLDLELYFGPGHKKTGILDYRPHFKESHFERPLSHLSAHPRHVHHLWPINNLRRLARRCSSRQEFLYARHLFLKRMKTFRAANSVLERLGRYDPWFAPERRSPPCVAGSRTNDGTIWMRFPFSLVWSRAGISRAIRDFTESPFGKHMLLEAWGRIVNLDLRIAWRLTSPSHVQRVGG